MALDMATPCFAGFEPALSGHLATTPDDGAVFQTTNAPARSGGRMSSRFYLRVMVTLSIVPVNSLLARS